MRARGRCCLCVRASPCSYRPRPAFHSCPFPSCGAESHACRWGIPSGLERVWHGRDRQRRIAIARGGEEETGSAGAKESGGGDEIGACEPARAIESSVALSGNRSEPVTSSDTGVYQLVVRVIVETSEWIKRTILSSGALPRGRLGPQP